MGTRSSPPELAHVLSGRALYRVCSHRRTGLVRCYASTLSTRCARYSHEGSGSDTYAHPHTPPHLDSITHAYTASNHYTLTNTFANDYAHSVGNTCAILYPANSHSMKRLNL